MKEIMKDILIGSTFKAAEIVIAKNIIAKLLYHEYKVKIYYKKNDDSRKNQDFLVLLHGIYGKSSDMESIAQNFKDNYRIINIQYPTTKETAEEISDLYIEPNIENIKEQIFSENFHKKINKIRIEFKNACWIGSASIGVVTVNDKIAAKDKILKAADKSVYDAKNAGKNKVVCFK